VSKLEPRGPFDLVVVGGGLAGTCAALAAARHGRQVALVQDRPVLGGNSSSEIRMHVCGADGGGHEHARETGILEELRLEDAVRNPQRCASLWDVLLWDFCRREPNLALFLNTVVVEAIMLDERRIRSVRAHQLGSERHLELSSELFLDATGDGRLGFEAGAEFRRGREAKSEFGESRAPDRPDSYTMGNSLLFQSRDMGRPMSFVAPPWAHVFPTDDDLPNRHHGSFECGYWWIEWGGQLDTIRDNEQIRDQLLKYLFGVWDHIKNRGDHGAENHALEWVGMLPGKRESRRLMGDHILTEGDIADQVAFEDRVAYGGWPIDLHPPGGIEHRGKPTEMPPLKRLYSIPLRCLYSRNIDNLFMAGRDASASSVAHGSTRVMATCAVMGQAAGTAAALCRRHGCDPRGLVPRHVSELQQLLLKDDCYLIGLRNEDPDDLARGAQATASSSAAPATGPEQVLSGVARTVGTETNCWVSAPDLPAWLELDFGREQLIDAAYLTFDTNLNTRFTLTHEAGFAARMPPRAPIAECVADYRLEAEVEGGWKPLADVRGNYQRRRIHRFDPVRATKLRLTVTRTNGDPSARVFEVRAYREGA